MMVWESLACSKMWTPLMFLNGTYKLIQSHMVF